MITFPGREYNSLRVGLGDLSIIAELVKLHSSSIHSMFIVAIAMAYKVDHLIFLPFKIGKYGTG